MSIFAIVRNSAILSGSTAQSVAEGKSDDLGQDACCSSSMVPRSLNELTKKQEGQISAGKNRICSFVQIEKNPFRDVATGAMGGGGLNVPLTNTGTIQVNLGRQKSHGSCDPINSRGYETSFCTEAKFSMYGG